MCRANEEKNNNKYIQLFDQQIIVMALTGLYVIFRELYSALPHIIYIVCIWC